MNNKVLLFACIEKNIGDDLFIKTICQRYNNIDFVISSKAKYGSLKYIGNLKFSIVLKYIIFIDSIKTNKNNIRKFIHVINIIIKKIFGKYKIGIYIVGNAFKNSKYEGVEQSKWIRERILYCEKFILLSTNFGPFVDKRWLIDCKNTFSNMKDVCFRDKSSYEMFKELKNVRYAPDAVLSMKKYLNLSENIERTIIISIIDCTYQAREQWLKELAIIYENKMAEIADYFMKNGYKVIIVNSNFIQDYKASKRILKKCKLKDITIYNYKGDIEEVMELFSKVKAVIATRLHSIILAWLYNKPVIPIVYDIKISSIINSYGYKGISYKISELENIRPESIEHEIMYNTQKLDEYVFKEAENQFAVLDSLLRKA